MTLLVALFSNQLYAFSNSIKYAKNISLGKEQAVAQLSLDNTVPVVELKLSGNLYRFIIDTGSEISKINKDILREIEYTQFANLKVLLNERPVDLEFYHVKKAQLEELTIEELPVTTLQDTLPQSFQEKLKQLNIHGILGFTAFKGLQLTFDFPVKQLVIEMPSMKPAQAAPLLQLYRESLPIQTLHFYNENYGIYVPAVIDTGFTGMFSMPSHINELPFSELYEALECISNHTAGTEPCTIRTFKANILLGPYLWKNPSVHFGSPSHISTLKKPYALVGMKLMQNYKITIDTKNHLIKWEK